MHTIGGRKYRDKENRITIHLMLFLTIANCENDTNYHFIINIIILSLGKITSHAVIMLNKNIFMFVFKKKNEMTWKKLAICHVVTF